MPKSSAFAEGLLKHLFQNANIANVGDGTGLRGSTTPGNLYVALHTASPDVGGSQTANETAYEGYERIAVPRTDTDWVVDGNEVNPAADVLFGECTDDAGAPLTHWSIGVAASSGGLVLYFGTLAPNITMAVGVQPKVKAASSVTET